MNGVLEYQNYKFSQNNQINNQHNLNNHFINNFNNNESNNRMNYIIYNSDGSLNRRIRNIHDLQQLYYIINFRRNNS